MLTKGEGERRAHADDAVRKSGYIMKVRQRFNMAFELPFTRAWITS